MLHYHADRAAQQPHPLYGVGSPEDIEQQAARLDSTAASLAEAADRAAAAGAQSFASTTYAKARSRRKQARLLRATAAIAREPTVPGRADNGTDRQYESPAYGRATSSLRR